MDGYLRFPVAIENCSRLADTHTSRRGLKDRWQPSWKQSRQVACRLRRGRAESTIYSSSIASWWLPSNLSSIAKQSRRSSVGQRQSIATVRHCSPVAWRGFTRGQDSTNECERWSGMETDFWKEGLAILPSFLSIEECDDYC